MIGRNWKGPEKSENDWRKVRSREGTRENIKILGFSVLMLKLKTYPENITCVIGKPWSFRS